MLVWKFDALDAQLSPIAAQRQKTSLSPLHSHLIWHPSCFPALCLPRLPSECCFSIVSHPLPFKCAKGKNKDEKDKNLCGPVKFKKKKKQPVRSRSVLFMKNSPLVDLLGVKSCRSTGTWLLGAFKNLPGENYNAVLKCTKCRGSAISLQVLFIYLFYEPQGHTIRIEITP